MGMLKFYYDFLIDISTRFIELVVLLQLDTESFYLAISGYSKGDHLEPDMREQCKEGDKAMTPVDNKIK